MNIISKFGRHIANTLALAAMCVAGNAMAAPSSYTFTQDYGTAGIAQAIVIGDAGSDGIFSWAEVASITLSLTGGAITISPTAVDPAPQEGLVSEFQWMGDSPFSDSQTGFSIATPENAAKWVMSWRTGYLAGGGYDVTSGLNNDSVVLYNTDTLQLIDRAPVSNTVVTVSQVPEPETYALMLAGLGLVGCVARRRKTA